MSTMKASEKLRSIAGANIAESMSRHQGGAGGSPNLQAARPADQDRFTGLNRIKGAFQIPPDRITPDPNQPGRSSTPRDSSRLAHEPQGTRPAPTDPGALGRTRWGNG